MISGRRSPRTKAPRAACVALTYLLIATCAAFSAASESQPERIVAVGDVHGSFDGLTAILKDARLIDENLRWSGGKTTLVQIGDLLDRGVDLQEVMDLMMRLQDEAAAAGGEVVCLLGNHEAMNVLGIVRDVNPESFARFADADSVEQREQASENHARALEDRARLFGLQTPHINRAERPHLFDDIPLGKFEYLKAMGPDGRYGAWLRTLPVAVQRGRTLFVHAGIGPTLSGIDLAAINHTVADEIRVFDSVRAVLADEGLLLATAAVPEVRKVADLVIQAVAGSSGPQALTLRRLAGEVEALDTLDDWWLVSNEGPLWFRGATEWDEDEFRAVVDSILGEHGADRMVVGHTPSRSGRIEDRFDGRIFAIDTGMLSDYYKGGRASALEIVDTTVTAIYGDRTEVLVGDAATPGLDPDADAATVDDLEPAFQQWRAWFSPDGEQLPFRTDAELEEYLLTAEILEDEAIGRGVTNPHKLLLEKDGIRAHAVFKDVDILQPGATRSFRKAYMNFRDYHLYEVAAYRVDRLLGLDRVPPAVQRTINNKKGTVQMWMEGTIMDVDRRDRDLSPPDPLRWRQQRQMMEVFDNLIGNSDSNLGNLLIDKTWTLWFIDHTRSFVRAPKPLYPQKIIFCEQRLWRALQALDAEIVSEKLRPYLSSYEIGAMMSRRDEIVRHLQSLIDARGEANVIYDLLPPGKTLDKWPDPVEE